MRRRRALLSRLLVVAVVAVPGVALADEGSVADPRGDAGARAAVDLIGATHGHSSSGVVVHTVTAADAITSDDFYGQGLPDLRLEIFLSKKKIVPDREIAVSFNPDGTSLRGLVVDRRGRLLGHANVWRSDERTVRIEFSRRVLGPGVKRYRWRVDVVSRCVPDEPGGLCGGPRHDQVPNSGTLRARVPGARGSGR